MHWCAQGFKSLIKWVFFILQEFIVSERDRTTFDKQFGPLIYKKNLKFAYLMDFLSQFMLELKLNCFLKLF
jgi:hypothetical protein